MRACGSFHPAGKRWLSLRSRARTPARRSRFESQAGGPP